MINLNKFMSCKNNDSKDIISRYAITKKTIRNCQEIIYAHYKKVL